MAIYGCLRPQFVPIDTTAAAPTTGNLPTYKWADKVVVGHLVQTNETINWVEASMYGDNRRVEHVRRFDNAQLDTDLDDILPDTATAVFGCDSDSGNNEVYYGTEDQAPWGCYSFCNTIQRTADNGTVSQIYKGMFYPMVQGTLQGTNSSTVSDSITFQSQKIIFDVKEAPSVKRWRITAEFDSEQDCLDWLDSMSGKPSGTQQTTNP